MQKNVISSNFTFNDNDRSKSGLTLNEIKEQKEDQNEQKNLYKDLCNSIMLHLNSNQ